MAASGLINALTGAAGALFGSDQNVSQDGRVQSLSRITAEENEGEVALKQGSTSGLSSTKTVLDQAAIDQIIRDTLSGPSGLADIFGGEQNVGLYDSSVSAQAAGDLAAKLVGNLALITSEQRTTESGQNVDLAETYANSTATALTGSDTISNSNTETSDDGLLRKIFG